MKSSIIQNITNLILPFIQVFGIYVILFGHLSPGGGFAGGSILGASLILFRFVNGSDVADAKFKYHYLLRFACSALVLYGVMKGYVFASAFLGLHDVIGIGTPGTLLSGGFIMPLNVLVGLVVAITFYFIAVLFEEGELEHADLME
ncbi:MnhB domain-containing protein [Fusibacter sp. 3D3]|uniref:MnhB domain-containing protein n=1 Tax=Fusibacter sp. 3D3 TaxID=1048380 RepID=UPI0008533566|nr:MnhB domain-containing protein [Fusibacter sp. 3D3]GAU79609.1 putative Na(+) H(+) antiporter subunit B [Fusibacter sp. 3D3]